MQSIKTKEKIRLLESEVRRFANKYSYIPDDVDDVVQESVIKVLTKKSIDLPINKNWLWVLVRNEARDNYRRHRRRNSYLDTTVSLSITDRPSSELNCYEPVYYEDNHHTEFDLFPSLKNLLAKLDKNLYQCLLLYAQGYSYKEIAAIVGIKIGTVRSRIYNARKELQPFKSEYL